MKKNVILFLFIIVNIAVISYIYFPIIKHIPKTKKVTVEMLNNYNRSNQEYILPVLRFHYKNGAIADCSILVLLIDFIFVVSVSYFLKKQNLKN
jgi:multisubunit Na+/H+ antiporter MnhF subunit